MKNVELFTKHRLRVVIVACLIALFAFGWGFMAKTQVNKPTTLTWQPAQKVVETALFQKVLKENFQSASNESFPNAVKVKVVTLAADQKYFVFDFNTAKLCGVAGCLYSAYTTDSQRILSLMLKPQLPKGFSLLVQSSETRNGYPCLDVFQRNSNELVSRSHFCFESGRLVLLNQSLNEVKS
ncbi:hypothetical protein H6S82_00100 [Planktothrix sp. FACHB-1355]|uniref:Uncharacterized protein n=1 Tax=Aerosakkonema funiforme FACHB-1375 TaxID=2949571 RepID=A0A926ZGR8_9CYAN|nr:MULTISPECIES: hypothetical protein [Oscillatoriales]MBD2181854.1 hypothetical protein [Aerosakkonema funiforme FACHB-1375]MBD3557274.1 hypothetical protein [Planktothrix sp. FACHB-1355]